MQVDFRPNRPKVALADIPKVEWNLTCRELNDRSPAEDHALSLWAPLYSKPTPGSRSMDLVSSLLENAEALEHPETVLPRLDATPLTATAMLVEAACDATPLPGAAAMPVDADDESIDMLLVSQLIETIATPDAAALIAAAPDALAVHSGHSGGGSGAGGCGGGQGQGYGGPLPMRRATAVNEHCLGGGDAGDTADANDAESDNDGEGGRGADADMEEGWGAVARQEEAVCVELMLEMDALEATLAQLQAMHEQRLARDARLIADLAQAVREARAEKVC